MQSQLSVYNELIFNNPLILKFLAIIPSHQVTKTDLLYTPPLCKYHIMLYMQYHFREEIQILWSDIEKNQVEMTAYWSDSGFQKKKIERVGEW